MTLPPRIGRYRIVELLGQGAMGVVYRGRDEGLDRDVAVKVIRGETLDDDSHAQFLKEARAAARLQHPGIVTVYELGEEGGTPFLAMELLEGQDLQHAMREGALSSPERALAVIEQVLAALGHAHARGIVHRDMKPSNVFLHAGVQAKILDFGVARLGEGLTVTGRVVGTPHYMSPEQVRAEPVDGRSDLFSTALIFYELVTGTKAYRPGSAVTVMYQIVHEDADLSRLPRTPRGAALHRVLRRALARDRSERYPDAAALAAALADAVDAHPEGPVTVATGTEIATVLSEPASDLDLGAAATPSYPDVDLPLAVERPEDRAPAPVPVDGGRRGAWAPAALVAVLLAGAAIVWWQTRRMPPAAGARPPAPVTASRVPSSSTSPTPTTTPPITTPSITASAPAPVSPPDVVPTASSLPPETVRPSSPPVRPVTPRPSADSGDVADVPSRLDRAERLFEGGHLRAALAGARAILRDHPDNAEARYLAEDIELDLAVEDRLRKARAALARGDRDTARAEAEAGLRLKPNESRLSALLRDLQRP